LVAMVAGSYYYNADRMLRKEYEAVKTEQKAKEKNEAWIKELEFRDEEEKERQGKNNRIRDKLRRRSEREKDDSEDKDKGVVALESTKELKVVKELKKVAQDTVEVVKDIIDTNKEE
jgi:hypothetical protein